MTRIHLWRTTAVCLCEISCQLHFIVKICHSDPAIVAENRQTESNRAHTRTVQASIISI